MQETNPENLKAIERKLTNLVNCILNKASTDPEFASQLYDILISDSLKAILREKKKRPKELAFNLVAFLHEHGKEELLKTLREKPDSDLRIMLRSEGIRKGKELKALERQQMIDEIFAHSEKKLKQGSVFL